MKKRFAQFLIALLLAFTCNQTTASAALANVKIFATSSGYGEYVDKISRQDGFVRVSSQVPTGIFYFSSAIYAQSSYNDNDLLYQSALQGSGAGITNIDLRCDANFNIRLYNKNKQKVATLKLIVYNTARGPCDVNDLDKESPNLAKKPDAPVEDDTPDNDEPVNDTGGQECSDIVCDCIENATDVLVGAMDKNGNNIVNAIKDGDKNIVAAIDRNTDAVEDGTKKIVSAVNKVTDAVNDLHDEFKTDKDYKIKDFPSDLELEKPDQPTKKYEDKKTYFDDAGDGDSIGPMPDVVPVKDWDGLKKEDDKTPEIEMTKDDEISKDNEMTKDNMSQDGEMTKDNFTKDSEMTKDNFTKDSEMTKDNFTKDSEMTKDDMSQDGEMTKDSMNKTEQYDQTHVYQKASSMTVQDLE